jgi:type VII secretion protein EccB
VRAPATRDQVDAYRFGLRRLEAALVRGDPVPLHEQIRSQRRAAMAGVLLGLLGLGGVAVFALVVPRPDWTRQTVVVGADSGSMYVVAHGPDRLVPVANLAAGRLVLAALRRGGAPGADPATATPVAVPDADLDAAPRTPTAAVPGAVAVRPDGAGVAPRWAVCDQTDADGRLLATTVIGGAALPPPLPPGEGMLATGPDDTLWLLTAGRRYRVDAGDGALMAAFGLTERLARVTAAGLLSALPVGPDLVVPGVPGRGGPAPAELPGQVGDVLVARPVGGTPRHFLVLAEGLQEVPPILAELLRVASGADAPREVDADVLGGATFVEAIPVAGWPAAAPRMLEPGQAPVLCWTWAAGADPAGGIWAGAALPLAPDSVPVTMAQADGPGERVDAVALGPGGAVRATGPGRGPGAGPLWLLSATGVGYGVADEATAAALGLDAAEPAPEAALRLLPAGPALDLAQAGRVVDVLPVGS